MISGASMFNSHSHHRLSLTRYILLAATLGFGMPAATARAFTSTPAATHSFAPRRLASRFAQESDSDEDNGVSSEQVEKYVAVYREMQRNRSLTVETAAAKEGLSLSEFRQLEQKIERDDDSRERARTELQAAAAPSPSATATAAPSTK
jgi:hypothetical protein